MDAATRTSLEIQRARDGGDRHTLAGPPSSAPLTPAGARMLAGWLAAPLTDPAAIGERQDAWSWLLANPNAAGEAAREPCARHPTSPAPWHGCR